jgi:hypothetical protein
MLYKISFLSVFIFSLLFLSSCVSENVFYVNIEDVVLSDIDLVDLSLYVLDDCVFENFNASSNSPLIASSFCSYFSFDESSEVIISISKYSNFDDLFGSYQYQSSHLRSVEGLISEDFFGDFSKFYVNVEEDYMGYLNDVDIYYYHLWIVSGDFLIHITSKSYLEEHDLLIGIAERFMNILN